IGPKILYGIECMKGQQCNKLNVVQVRILECMNEYTVQGSECDERTYRST
ncbi:hypothetical protein S83_035155, partial [Arachis hypogaea]